MTAESALRLGKSSDVFLGFTIQFSLDLISNTRHGLQERSLVNRRVAIVTHNDDLGARIARERIANGRTYLVHLSLILSDLRVWPTMDGVKVSDEHRRDTD
jgi:hypothetical protein